MYTFTFTSCTLLRKVKTNRINRKYLLIFLVFFFSCTERDFSEKSTSAEIENGIQHIDVYREDRRSAGWPANNGAWNWGDEILVGFVDAEHYEKEGFQTINQKTARKK